MCLDVFNKDAPQLLGLLVGTSNPSQPAGRARRCCIRYPNRRPPADPCALRELGGAPTPPDRFRWGDRGWSSTLVSYALILRYHLIRS